MSSLLAGATVAVLGGDDRELVLVPELVRHGADVRVAGISGLAGSDGVAVCDTVEEAVWGAGFVVLPMPGVDENGFVRAKYAARPLQLNREAMSSFSDDCVIIVGFARPLLKDLVAERGLRLIEIGEWDEVAIANSVPSAEGAIQMAMEATDITIHGSNTLVLGFGRCGITLARMLDGIGARVTVAARKPRDLARIREMGLRPVTYRELPECIGTADIVFNTVPALILTRELLEKANPGVYICDIASAPGGVDFAAARDLGIRAELAPGLPGRVAPRTAGQILARIIPEIIANGLAGISPATVEWDRR